MSLLTPTLADVLRCPCGADAGFEEHPDPADPESGSIACRACGRRSLVVDSIPIITPPLEARPAGPGADAAAQVVRAALGRFHDMLGGLEGARRQATREPLEHAFTVAGADWISLSRFDWERNERLARLVPGAGPVVDLGCGFGCSSAPFAEAGRSVVGVDENLFFLLLFRRYARERGLAHLTSFVCADAGRTPLPFADASFDGVLAASFFNHYACLRSARVLRRFFAETARVLPPGGALVMDMVPSRRHPFPSEINLGEAIPDRRVRGVARRAVRRLPTRWLPGNLTVLAIFALYRLHSAVRRRPAFGLRTFREQIGKGLPEVALGGLPFTDRGWRRLARGFSTVELGDNPHRIGSAGRLEPPAGGGLHTPYFVMRALRGPATAATIGRGPC